MASPGAGGQGRKYPGRPFVGKSVEMTSLLAQSPDLQLPAPRSAGFFRWALSRLKQYMRVQPPPVSTAPAEQALYGFAQPMLGARVLLNDPELLREALVPALFMAGACALYATVGGEHDHGWFRNFYTAFATLAPLPSLIFANHYARLAAQIRWRLGFGACGPREMPFGMLLGRLVRQTLIVALGVIPFAAVWKIIPGLGQYLSQAVLAAWALHWVVADAFDDAQVLAPGENLRESIRRDRDAGAPWFVRVMNTVSERLPRFAGRPLRAFARLCDKLAMDSRGEISIMEKNRSISLGFGLSTAALLATPVLNLVFRPIILAASSHLLGHLEQHEPHPPAPQLR